MWNGALLHAARKKAGLDQETLGYLIDVHKVTISRYENNEREPRVSDLIKLAKALNISVNFLMRDLDDSEGAVEESHTAPALPCPSKAPQRSLQKNTPTAIMRQITEILELIEDKAADFDDDDIEITQKLLHRCIKTLEKKKTEKTEEAAPAEETD